MNLNFLPFSTEGFYFFFICIGQLLIGVSSSYLLSELVRDIWHVTCHRNRFLWLYFHSSHHLAYKAEWLKKSEEIYRHSQWTHDVIEAIIMLIANIIYFLACYQLTFSLFGN